MNKGKPPSSEPVLHSVAGGVSPEAPKKSVSGSPNPVGVLRGVIQDRIKKFGDTSDQPDSGLALDQAAQERSNKQTAYFALVEQEPTKAQLLEKYLSDTRLTAEKIKILSDPSFTSELLAGLIDEFGLEPLLEAAPLALKNIPEWVKSDHECLVREVETRNLLDQGLPERR